jgi:AHBA synthesis associated protein
MRAHTQIVWHGREIEGVVFDLDGTLTDSVQVYYEVFREASRQVGVRMEKEDIFGPLAEGLEPWNRAFPPEMPDREGTMQAFRRAMRPAFIDALQRVRPLPGVEEMLRVLQENGMKLGVVTDSSVGSLLPLRNYELLKYFSAVITRDDGFPRKPEPSGLLECLKRMAVDPGHAILVGDTLMDMRAGKQAGTLTVGVLTGLATRCQLKTMDPTALLDDVTRFPEVLSLTDRTG